jgi:carbon-monoxide dehydrogenase small subunit
VKHGAVQCGFCTPGFVVQATHLLEKNPHVSAAEIQRGIEGNLCRCTGYRKIVEAIADAALADAALADAALADAAQSDQ